MYDYAIVGGGMGGAMAAALLAKRDKKVVLFEKEPYLGGCASTFKRGEVFYNTGATTLAGYEKGLVVYELFEEIGVKPTLKELEFSHIAIQNGRKIRLYSDVERFVDELNSSYYHPKNLAFWRVVKRICDDFYATNGYFYSTKDPISRVKSMLSFAPAAIKFLPYLATNAKLYIKNFFGLGLSEEYLRFLDAQTMIAVQSDTSKINFLTAALALGYPFFKNYYVFGGMGAIFDELAKGITKVHTNEIVSRIERTPNGYTLYTKNRMTDAKNIVLNTPVFSSSKLFSDRRIASYFDSKRELDSKQSGFVVYIRIKSEKELAHHYQIISSEKLPYTISNAVFVSFSDIKDERMSKNGELSVTASIHTMSSFWIGADRELYEKQKEGLKNALISLICDNIGIKKSSIVSEFAATPLTFEWFIGRSSLGGTLITPKNMIKLASNDTPFEGLYCVGDTVFAAQGWPGVAIGVRNLLCTI